MVEFVKRDKSDIFSRPVMGFIFKNARFLLAIRVVTAALFFYAVYFGFAYPGRDNIFTGALFWGIFWALFMVSTLPTFGRIFCGICPHGFLGKYITAYGLKKTMPKWMQNRYIGITLIVIGWWGIYYTFPGFWRSPIGTASMFAGMTVIAFVLYFIYKDMSYCKSVCPIGTLTRAYDKLAFTKLETYTDSCKECKTFECAQACHYNLKPFTFAKKNSIDDCTLCMDCANACEAVKFSLTKPAGKLEGRFKTLPAEVWTYILIIASIPVSMAFAHGLERSKISHEMVWNKTAVFMGLPELGGMFSFLYAILFTVSAAVLGLWLASLVLQKTFKTTFTTLGYAYAPLFILGSLGHALESFFTKGYEKIVEGFAQGFGFSVDVTALASRGDAWLHYFGILKWIGIVWTLILLYKRLKLIESTRLRKIVGYLFASMLVIFFISLNVYRGYVFKTYGAKQGGGHNHGAMHSGQMFQSVPFKDAVLLHKGEGGSSCATCGMKLSMFFKTNHAATHKDKTLQMCSIHCLADEIHNHKKDLTSLKVVEVKSLKFIDASSAFYVVGSSKSGTMSKVSKYAFAVKADADSFAKKFGGKTMRFDEAMKVALKDFGRGRPSHGLKEAKVLSEDDLLFYTLTNPAMKKGKARSMGHMHGGHGGGKKKWGAVPTKQGYLVFGKALTNSTCISKLPLSITAYDTTKSVIQTELISKMGCEAYRFEVPNNGYYTLLATHQSVKENTLYHRVAKLEYLSGRHGRDDVYTADLSEPLVSEAHKLDLIRLRDESEESFYYKHATGDNVRFRALLDGKPLSGADVTVSMDTGWTKTLQTDQEGIASFRIIKDYFPEWSEFDRRHKGEFLVSLAYTSKGEGELDGKPYSRTKYAITYPASFYPAESEYKSYGYGLILITLTLLFSGVIVYRYRKNRTKPFGEVKYEE